MLTPVAPNLVTSRRILASAARALFIDLRRLSLKVKAESSHTPNHLVASLAEGTLLSSTCTPLLVGRMLGLTPSAEIWCVDRSLSTHFPDSLMPIGCGALRASSTEMCQTRWQGGISLHSHGCLRVRENCVIFTAGRSRHQGTHAHPNCHKFRIEGSLCSAHIVSAPDPSRFKRLVRV